MEHVLGAPYMVRLIASIKPTKIETIGRFENASKYKE